jgi:hypothetical protein
MIRNALGPNHTEIRATTGCTNLDRSATFHIQSNMQCVEIGDPVAASDLGGPVQHCRILGFAPYKPAP